MSLKTLLQRVHSQNHPSYPPGRHLLCALLGSVVGYKYGYRWCDDEDYSPYLTKYESEEQQYSLISQTGKPILLFLYVPGDPYSIYMRPSVLKAAKAHH